MAPLALWVMSAMSVAASFTDSNLNSFEQDVAGRRLTSKLACYLKICEYGETAWELTPVLIQNYCG